MTPAKAKALAEKVLAGRGTHNDSMKLAQYVYDETLALQQQAEANRAERLRVRRIREARLSGTGMTKRRVVNPDRVKFDAYSASLDLSPDEHCFVTQVLNQLRSEVSEREFRRLWHSFAKSNLHDKASYEAMCRAFDVQNPVPWESVLGHHFDYILVDEIPDDETVEEEAARLTDCGEDNV